MIDSPFNPDDIRKKDMDLIADHLEEFLQLLDEIMVIPEELVNKKDDIKEAVDVAYKLVKKLRKGDMGVFKDLN